MTGPSCDRQVDGRGCRRVARYCAELVDRGEGARSFSHGCRGHLVALFDIGGVDVVRVLPIGEAIGDGCPDCLAAQRARVLPGLVASAYR